MPQGSEEWFAQRLGKITASRAADVMARTKSGPGAARKNYMMELLCQRLTGQFENGFTSAAMQRGIDLEPVARSAYEMKMDVIVHEVDFCPHHKYELYMGASPDGMVDGEGLIEIKCPNTAQHIACLQSEKYDEKYFWQMQFQMACTERAWCDFVSYDDRLPEPLDLFIYRVARDQEAIDNLEKECLVFLDELGGLENAMREKMK